MIKGSVHQDDITILNVHVPNNFKMCKAKAIRTKRRKR